MRQFAAGLLLVIGGSLFIASAWRTRLSAMPETPAVKFAEDRAPKDAPADVPFDGDKAIKHLEALCDLGPRVSGSEAIDVMRKKLVAHFEQAGLKVTLQKFEGKQRSQKAPVAMANIVASWEPDKKRRVLICGHYDTRPLADQEANRRDWNKPFASANDGTSTAALMMELAGQMKAWAPTVGVDFVLFDGEEWVFDRDLDRYFLGSEHFAAEWKRAKERPDYAGGVLLDLFAGKGAKLRVESHSWQWAPKLVEQVFAVAIEAKAKSFEWGEGPDVLDDHIALNRVGIPCIDLIDFDYKHWHKLSDTPDKCSGEQMAEVAKVLTRWVRRVR